MAQAFTLAELAGADTSVFSEERSVRFQEVDAAGIVFYPRVLEYFSDVYMNLLAERGVDVPTMLSTESVGLPLVHAEADYRAPLCFGDRIRVEIVEIRMGESSFTVGYRVRRFDERIAALGQTVHVCIDRGSFRSRPIPDALRAALSQG